MPDATIIRVGNIHIFNLLMVGNPNAVMSMVSNVEALVELAVHET